MKFEQIFSLGEEFINSSSDIVQMFFSEMDFFGYAISIADIVFGSGMVLLITFIIAKFIIS